MPTSASAGQTCDVEKKLTDTSENVLKRLRVDKLGDLGRVQRTVGAEEVRGETSNVRSSHGSSRDHVGLPIVPSGNDVQTRSPDIDDGTEIGERGLCILDSRSANGDSLLNTSGRVFARVIVIVSGGDSDGNATVVKLKTESLVSSVPSLSTTRRIPLQQPYRGRQKDHHPSS